MAPAQAPTTTVDPFRIARLYEPLRVADVADGLDGIGYFDVGLVGQEIRPLWLGMRFWGPALTVRCVPANKPMWTLDTTEDVVKAHAHWFDRHGHAARGLSDLIQPGHVVVMDAGSAREVGFWGSENSLGVTERGGVGIVTNGHARDTGELALQRTPICCRARGRTIIPGRIEAVEMQTTIGIGGAQVRPGDIVGCDDDGLVVVPIEVAEQVAMHAKEVLLADMRSRRRRYDALGRAHDASVDTDAIERHYAALA